MTREGLEAALELRDADVAFPGRPGEHEFAIFVVLYRCGVRLSIRQIVDAIDAYGLLDWVATKERDKWDRLETALETSLRRRRGEFFVKHGESLGSTYECVAPAAAGAEEPAPQPASRPAAKPAPRAKRRRADDAEPAPRTQRRLVDDSERDTRHRVDHARLRSAAAENLDAEARAHFDFAKSMQDRGIPGYGVQNEAGRCGLVRVSTGYTPCGSLRVHEFDCACVPERRSHTHPLDVLSGCSFLSPYAPGWKRAADGAFEWT